MAEVVLSQELPDVFDRIEFRAIGRQMQKADVFGHDQLVARLVPACAVEDEHRMVAVAHLAADLGQVQGHCRGVGLGQDQGRGGATARADGAEQVGPAMALVAGRAWPAALGGPHPGQGPLLADPGFVLPPELQRLAAGGVGEGAGNQSGKVFL